MIASAFLYIKALRGCILLLLLLLLRCHEISAQQMIFTRYTMYDGLVANPVRCVFQDSKGYLWIGTYDGLSRYDGYRFTNLTAGNGVSHNVINAIQEIDGKVIVGENDGSIDIFEQNVLRRKIRLQSAVNFVGSAWQKTFAATDNHGLVEYSNENLKSFVRSKSSYALGRFIEISNNLMLCEAADGKLLIFNKKLEHLASLNDPDVHFYTIQCDSKNRVWACSSSGLKLIGISAISPSSISYKSLPPQFNIPQLTDVSVTCMAEDAEGSLWFGTGKGLLRMDTLGKWRLFTEQDGLPSARITTLYLDREKNLWIGTSLGLAKWVSKNYIAVFDTENQDYIQDIIVSQSGEKNIYLTTENGLHVFNPATKTFRKISKPFSDVVLPISNTTPQLALTNRQIALLEKDMTNPVIATLLNDDVGTGVVASQYGNTFIIGSFEGLYSINGTTVKKLTDKRITSVATDKRGNIWVGTWQSGIFRVSPVADSLQINEITEWINGEHAIRGIYTDSKNNVWVGTRYSGAFCLTPDSSGNYTVTRFTKRSGLMSDWVMSFAETAEGDMWIGTYLGIDRLIKETNHYRVFNFSRATNFFAETKKIVPYGNYWLCSANTGIALFKDEKLHLIPPVNPVLFSATLGLGEKQINVSIPAKATAVPATQNAAHFVFGALEYINERHLFYSYRLLGSGDTSWSRPQNVHEASYASLSPGFYRFEVRTLGWNNKFSKPAILEFTIQAPFWKKWWFIALELFLAGLIAYAFYRYRVAQILKVQKMRNNIADDLHDDIGSSLTNISILAELSNSNRPGLSAKNISGRIAEESGLAQQALDDIIWSVNSSNDNPAEMLARMRRYAAEVLEPAGIKCITNFTNTHGKRPMNMEQRKDVYLVFKECLNNVIKHALATEVTVEANLTDTYLNLSIADNGTGFNTATSTHRSGLKNLRTRVERWGGIITVESIPGSGTVIRANLPLSHQNR